MTTEQHEPDDDLEPIDIGDAVPSVDDLEPIDEDDYERDYDLDRKEDDLDDSSLTVPAPIPGP